MSIPRTLEDMTDPPFCLFPGEVIAMSKIMEYGGADVLADVLDSLKLRGRFFCQCELSAPWSLGFAAGFFSHFHVIERGTCWLQVLGASGPVAL